MKFNDLNGNGVRDLGEPGLANWTIKVTDSSGHTQTTITDSQGNYSFTVPAPGTYSVSELLQSGWISATMCRRREPILRSCHLARLSITVTSAMSC